MGDLIRPLVMSHEAFVNDAGLTLEYDAEPDVIVYGDRDMLRQATANLISNAVRYTPAPGKITVSVKRGDVMAAIAVRDTGIGLSPEERRMVFKRFWRAEESRQRQSGGLGVGLAVVKEIVDRHGGWVLLGGAYPRAGQGPLLLRVPECHCHSDVAECDADVQALRLGGRMCAESTAALAADVGGLSGASYPAGGAA